MGRGEDFLYQVPSNPENENPKSTAGLTSGRRRFFEPWAPTPRQNIADKQLKEHRVSPKHHPVVPEGRLEFQMQQL